MTQSGRDACPYGSQRAEVDPLDWLPKEGIYTIMAIPVLSVQADASWMIGVVRTRWQELRSISSCSAASKVCENIVSYRSDFVKV